MPDSQHGGIAGIVRREIETADPEGFQRFHSALSGWSFQPALADTELGADATAATPSAGTRVYFAVEDLEATLERVVSLGGSARRSRTALRGDDRWVVRLPRPDRNVLRAVDRTPKAHHQMSPHP